MVRYRPYVVLSAAISLDGKIATRSGDSQLSSKKDSRRVHKLRSGVDAILVGRKTVSVDNPLLTVRHLKGKNPTRIILDSKGTIRSDSKILKTCKKVPTIIVVSEKITKSNLARLQKFPIDVIQCGKNKINLKQLFRILYRKKIKKILVEGGGTTNWSLIECKLVDEIIVTVTPFIIGGKKAISLIEGKGFDTIPKSLSLKLKKIIKMNSEIVLNYTV
ncbi:MAG: 2,5-diamino-6-(ribosylamino)-4(3H)-pyrimidinone 5'-phosphate reductase [Nitrosopumilaceae archaeon]|nr:MAG: 2,5-diamino-6-ribosylamino-4(3H)-pyrimidinone 5'-phosphate reductase [Marine Group I thaumarchaeote]